MHSSGGVTRAAATLVAACLTGCSTAAQSSPRPSNTVTVTVTAPAVTTTTPARDVLPAGDAVVLLEQLPVAERGDPAGYDRAHFGQAWSDDVTGPSGHNGCDQRNDVLRRDLRQLAMKPGTNGCVVLSGTVVDAYTREPLTYARGKNDQGVQVDHVVALSNAWVTGARNLHPEQRQDLAGDPLNLLAVSAKANQAKGDADASEWLPPSPEAQCPYVARQIAVKHRYGLWITPTEQLAMRAVLSSCPNQQTPTSADVAPPDPQE